MRVNLLLVLGSFKIHGGFHMRKMFLLLLVFFAFSNFYLYRKAAARGSTDYQEFLSSIAWQDYDRVDFFLTKYPHFVNYRKSDNDSTPLMSSVYISAAKDGYKSGLKIIDLLLQKGAKVNARTTSGWDALHGAVWYGDLNVVKKLLDNHADVNSRNIDGDTPLDVAFSVIGNDLKPRVNWEIVKILSQRGAIKGK